MNISTGLVLLKLSGWLSFSKSLASIPNVTSCVTINLLFSDLVRRNEGILLLRDVISYVKRPWQLLTALLFQLEAKSFRLTADHFVIFWGCEARVLIPTIAIDPDWRCAEHILLVHYKRKTTPLYHFIDFSMSDSIGMNFSHSLIVSWTRSRPKYKCLWEPNY